MRRAACTRAPFHNIYNYIELLLLFSSAQLLARSKMRRMCAVCACVWATVNVWERKRDRGRESNNRRIKLWTTTTTTKATPKTYTQIVWQKCGKLATNSIYHLLSGHFSLPTSAAIILSFLSRRSPTAAVNVCACACLWILLIHEFPLFLSTFTELDPISQSSICSHNFALLRLFFLHPLFWYFFDKAMTWWYEPIRSWLS